MPWIQVTAIPNKQHLDSAPRARMLLNTDNLVAIEQAPDEQTQVWTDWNPDTSSLAVVESLEDLAQQLGLRPAPVRQACCLAHEWHHTPDGQRQAELLQHDREQAAIRFADILAGKKVDRA